MPLPALMSQKGDTWYYMVSANFYTNHVGSDARLGRSSQIATQQSTEAYKGVRGRQGAKGAKTSLSSMLFAAKGEALKQMINAELKAANAAYVAAGKDADGHVHGEFTSQQSYNILTAFLDGTEETVAARFRYGVCYYPDKRYRITHYAGLAT